MVLSIQECADSIVTRLFTVNWMQKDEKTGTRIAIKQGKHGVEKDLGGYCYEAAKTAVEEELRVWLGSLDDEPL